MFSESASSNAVGIRRLTGVDIVTGKAEQDVSLKRHQDDHKVWLEMSGPREQDLPF